MTWMEHTIKDEKLFSPRPYQILINSCSAKKKVLRMGRRCLEENEKVIGVKKSYRARKINFYNFYLRKEPSSKTCLYRKTPCNVN